MVIERPLELGQPRREVWCSLNEIKSNGDGTYSFVNLPDKSLGYGSKVYVVDSPNMILYFDNESGLLYNWNKFPIASGTTLGGIKVGEGLYINSEGVLSVSETGVLVVGRASETLSTTETSKTVNFTGSFITAYATMNDNKINLDIIINENSVVFTVGEVPSSPITCIVIYGEENE